MSPEDPIWCTFGRKRLKMTWLAACDLLELDESFKNEPDAKDIAIMGQKNCPSRSS